MTGTAMTEATEFAEIYKLDVIEIPTNQPVRRIDSDDEVYRTGGEKNEAIVVQVRECHERKQPVLVGTISIEKSETLAALFKKNKIPHHVLNARYHEQEAFIIAQAGRPGAVTIATNMAGRGTDIQLGGNYDMRVRQDLAGIEDEAERARRTAAIRAEIDAAREIVVAAGGLFVIASERHESRRIDNQLRGRSGRQGDPGASKFFVSLEDDLMRIFGSERMDGMLQKLGLKEGEAIIHPWINKALEKAQQKVEARNYEIRKQLLKYDDVMNDQRKVVYEQRKEIMSARDVASTITDMRHEVIDGVVARCVPPNALPEQWDAKGLHEEGMRLLGIDLPAAEWVKEEGIADAEIISRMVDAADRKMAEKAANYGPDIMRMAEKSLLLQLLDQTWKDHLLSLDHLRQGINLRAYAQRDPLNEYKREAFELFETMLSGLRETVTGVLCHVELRVQRGEDALPQSVSSEMEESRQDPALVENRATGTTGRAAMRSTGGRAVAMGAASATADPGVDPRTPRNAACPCGSGKKYKHCHGRV
jgi:preprotein translocase subunit SecA